jgi:hypothetical protein
MKFHAAIFPVLLALLTSCGYINAFNDRTIPVGDSGTALIFFAEDGNYFLGKRESDNNFAVLVEAPVINIKGNDSILFVQRGNSAYATFYIVDMNEYHPRAFRIGKWEYQSGIKKIKLKYDITPN